MVFWVAKTENSKIFYFYLHENAFRKDCVLSGTLFQVENCCKQYFRLGMAMISNEAIFILTVYNTGTPTRTVEMQCFVDASGRRYSRYTPPVYRRTVYNCAQNNFSHSYESDPASGQYCTFDAGQKAVVKHDNIEIREQFYKICVKRVAKKRLHSGDTLRVLQKAVACIEIKNDSRNC